MKFYTASEYMSSEISFEKRNKKIISLQKWNFIQLVNFNSKISFEKKIKEMISL